MPCQCGNTTVAKQPDAPPSGCDCATDSTERCQCATGTPTPSESASLERVVMDLEKRVLKLEAGR